MIDVIKLLKIFKGQEISIIVGNCINENLCNVSFVHKKGRRTITMPVDLINDAMEGNFFLQANAHGFLKEIGLRS